jgi:cytochrome c-type biogenesis protein CcmH
MNTLLRLVVISIITFSINVYSNDEPIEFNNPQHEQRYYDLIEEVRCLVCQNQSLSDSNAELAQDLRKEIIDMITSGKDNDYIIDFLVQRYGDFVLYRPPLKENTWLLWFGPFLFLIVGLITAIVIIRKQSSTDFLNTEINEEQEKRLEEMLNKTSNGDKE